MVDKQKSQCMTRMLSSNGCWSKRALSLYSRPNCVLCGKSLYNRPCIFFLWVVFTQQPPCFLVGGLYAIAPCRHYQIRTPAHLRTFIYIRSQRPTTQAHVHVSCGVPRPDVREGSQVGWCTDLIMPVPVFISPPAEEHPHKPHMKRQLHIE